MAKRVGFYGGKFLPPHLGHIYAIITAANMVDELYVVVTTSEKRDREIAARDKFPYVSGEKRLSWLGEITADMENVKLLEVEDYWGDADYDWAAGAEMIKRAIGKKIDVIFSSEPDYRTSFSRDYPEAEHVVIDAERSAFPVSATKIRKDLYKYWDFLPKVVQRDFTKRVLVTGTESCGKSTLVRNLAKAYNTSYVHEIGRDYSEKKQDFLKTEDFYEIGILHYAEQIKKLKEANKVMFVDSDAVVTNYYLDLYFKKNFPLLTEISKIQNYDLILYMAPDVPWVDDGLRTNGAEEVRKRNDRFLRGMYDELGMGYEVITGGYQERFARSKELVDGLLSTRKKYSFG